MKSHEYPLTWRELWNGFAPTLGLVLAALGTLLAANHWQFLPEPAISSYPDLTMLAHQARASRQHDDAQIVLLGDSTCLMGIDAVRLSAWLPGQPSVLNLSLISGLSLNTYGKALAEFAATNPGKPATAILLLSPGKLNSPSSAENESAVWENLAHPGSSQQHVSTDNDSLVTPIRSLLRENLLSHLLDTPLNGNGAEYFGFASRIDQYLADHRGSLVDFGNYTPPKRRQRTTYQLAPAFAPECRAFRAQVPAGTRLIIGLTPGARSTGSRDDWARRNEVLNAWNSAIHADRVLTNLPTTLPDSYFSATGHLNETGQREFTRLVAEELQRP